MNADVHDHFPEEQYRYYSEERIDERSPGSGLGTGLFGGPASTLFGTGMQASVAHDDREAQYSGVENSNASGAHRANTLGSGVDGGDDSAYEASYRAAGNEPDPRDRYRAASKEFTESELAGMDDSGTLVRPYAMTGGRTRPDYDLAIEALISTSERGMTADAVSRPEHRSICGLCTETRSVAEIAAHMRLPLGVVRVLIGDMAGMGLVSVHQSGMVVGDRPSMAFLERVLSGLRRL